MSALAAPEGITKLASVSLWLSLAHILYGFFLGYWTMVQRNKYVDVKILEDKLGNELKKHDISPAMFGYPDMGNGKYGCALPFSNWYKWNCAMKAHQNAAENVVVSVVATLGNLFFCGYAGAVIGAAILVTRVLHTVVYMVAPSKVVLASRLNTFCISSGLLLALYRSF